ncbi:MAG TPA: PAS domain S-box protein [Planctomycetaceae bacterium]|nr:PAS domain S-box protein [Planctomycetaceae bacterium]
MPASFAEVLLPVEPVRLEPANDRRSMTSQENREVGLEPTRARALFRGQLPRDRESCLRQLSCFYEISELIAEHGAELGAVLQGAAEILQRSWQDPQRTAVRIVLRDRQFTAGCFGETPRKWSVPLRVRNERSGTIEVCCGGAYADARQPGAEDQEQSLLESVALRLGKTIERIEAEEALRAAHENLEQRIRQRTAKLAEANAALRDQIDRHRRTERALARSESKLRRLILNMPDFVVVVDREGIIQFANRGIGPMSAEQLVGDSGFRFMVPGSRERCEQALQRAVETGQVQNVECLDVFGIVLQCRVVPLEGGEGREQAMVICTDVTEHQRNEELLRQQRDLSVALNSITDLYQALDRCCQAALEAIGMDAAGIYLVQQDGGLELVVHRGVSEKFVEVVGHFAPDAPLVRMARGSHALFFGPDDLGEPVATAVAAEGIRGAAVVPIHHDGQWLACLVLASRTLEQIPAPARRAVEAIAASVGGAIARIRAEEALRQSEETWRALVNAPTESALLIETDGTIVTLNETAARRLGHDPSEMIGRCLYDFFPEPLAQSRRAVNERVIRSGRAVRAEDNRDGRTYEAHIYPVYDAEGRVIRLAIYAQDVTEQRRAQDKLWAEQQLLRRLFELQEKERKLVSHEIHDGFVQEVVGAQMLLDAAVAALESRPEDVPGHLRGAREMLARGLAEARRMISELRPLIIDEGGLVEAINYLAARENEMGRIHVDVDCRLQLERIDPIFEGTIFRIIQESLNNAKRHSHSPRVTIRLEETDDQTRLEVADQGVGFRLEEIPEDRFGIRGILERSRLFGGRATIHTAPGQGTRVIVQLPLAEMTQADLCDE